MSTPSERTRRPAHQPTLFEVPAGPPPETPTPPSGAPPGPPAETPPAAGTCGRPRLRTANRQQIVFRAAPLDALLPQDHPARVVWDYVGALDLSPLYDRIKS